MAGEDQTETFFEALVRMFDELLVSGHPAVIHFPIIGVMMGAAAGISALLIAIAIDLFSEKLSEDMKQYGYKLIDRFEFSSWILVFMGEVSLIVAGWTGFRSSGGVDVALSNEILAFKVKMTIWVFFILLAPLLLKVFFSVKLRKPIFYKSRIIPILYILPLIISAGMIMVLSGAGGRYVYGHSILDTLGLGWIFPFGE